MSTAACGSRPGAGKYLPLRRRSRPSSTRPSATSRGAEVAHLGLLERQFGCRAEKLRPENVRVGGVDDHPLDRFVQQRRRMVDQIGVQRIVAGDQHHQRTLAAPARAAGLLPERRDRPGKTGEHHRVQPGDVDAQLQRVGGGQAAQPALGQGTLQRAAVLGEITGPVRRHRCATAPERCRPAAPGRPARSVRQRAANARTSGSALPRRSGRPSPAPPRRRRNGAPAHRSRR